MPENKNTCIEIFGLPGSGKTTLVERLRVNLASEGVYVGTRLDIRAWLKATNRLNKLACIVGSAPAFLHDANLYNKSVAQRTNRSRRWRMAIKGGLLGCYLERFRNDFGSGLFVLDEWYLQWFWAMSLLSDEPDVARVEESVRRFLLSDVGRAELLVYLDMQPDIAAERVCARTGEDTVFDNRPLAEVDGMLRKAEPAMRGILEATRGTPCPVLVLDALDLPHANAEKIGSMAKEFGLL